MENVTDVTNVTHIKMSLMEMLINQYKINGTKLLSIKQ